MNDTQALRLALKLARAIVAREAAYGDGEQPELFPWEHTWVKRLAKHKSEEELREEEIK